MRFAAQLRRAEADGRPAGASRRSKAAPTPTARHVAGRFRRRPADRKPERRAHLERVPQADATLATAYRLTQDCAVLVRERQGERLDAWLTEAEACELPALQRLAKGVRADLDAVRAGPTETWSNGPTEGFVHKFKLLKRQGYGRASFDLLRQRVLAA
jgi:transposase